VHASNQQVMQIKTREGVILFLSQHFIHSSDTAATLLCKNHQRAVELWRPSRDVTVCE